MLEGEICWFSHGSCLERGQPQLAQTHIFWATSEPIHSSPLHLCWPPPSGTLDIPFLFSGNIVEKKSKGGISNIFAYYAFGAIYTFYGLSEKGMEEPHKVFQGQSQNDNSWLLKKKVSIDTGLGAKLT